MEQILKEYELPALCTLNSLIPNEEHDVTETSTRTVIKNRHFLDSLAFLISAGQDVAITGTFSANRTVLHIASSGTNAVGALEQISRELSLFADDGKTPRLFDFALY